MQLQPIEVVSEEDSETEDVAEAVIEDEGADVDAAVAEERRRRNGSPSPSWDV